MKTRPPASEPKDFADWEIEARLRSDSFEERLDRSSKNAQRPQKPGDDNTAPDRFSPDHGEPSLTAEPSFFVKVTVSIFASLVTTGIVWITGLSVSTARKMDVLIERPAPVPLSQYESDMRQLKEQISMTTSRVTAIETRQVETLNKYEIGPQRR